MTTKKELEEQNKTLKSKLKEALSSIKEAPKVKLTDKALGVTKIDGKFFIVEVVYNHETKQAEVVGLKDAGKNQKSVPVLTMTAKEYLIEEVIDQLLKKGE